MSIRFGLFLPLWSAATGADGLLERAVGEIGLDRLTLPLVTGPHCQMRFASGFEAPDFATEGGCHFQPNSDLYRDLPVRVRPAAWCGSRDTLRPIGEYAQRHELPLYYHVDVQRSPALTDQAPGWRPKTAWGTELPGVGPSICQPGFRELVRLTLQDLRQRTAAGVQLTLRDPARLAAGSAETAYRPVGADLYHTCFCSACREVAVRAGVDVDAARRGVRDAFARAQREFHSRRPADAQTERLLPPDELAPVEAYGAALRMDVAAWLAGLGRALEGVVRELEYPERPFAEGWARVQVERYDALASGEGSPPRVAAEDEAPAVTVLRVRFDRVPAGPDELVRTLIAAARQGVPVIELEGLELLPDETVKWLRQAVRFARREATDE